jgi:hypothetical protein
MTEEVDLPAFFERDPLLEPFAAGTSTAISWPTGATKETRRFPSTPDRPRRRRLS